MRLTLPFACLFLVLAALLPTAGFYDLYLLPWQSRLIFTEHPNLWRAMKDNGAAYLPFTNFSALPYGPLFYYPMGLWVFLLDRLRLIDIHAWSDFNLATGSMRYTALLKLPNLAAYLATGLVLRRTLPGRAGLDAMLLWLLNPAVILGAFVMGQNDGWSILAVLVALLFAARSFESRTAVEVLGRRIPSAPLAMAALGAGAAVKLHPLLFVVPFAFVLGRSWRGRIALAAVALAVFALLIAPFLGDSFFRDNALFSPQGENILRYRLGPLPVFYPAYVMALLPVLRRDRPLASLLATLVAVHLLVFALSDWPPERAAWFIGALAVPAVLSPIALVAYVLATAQALLVAMELGNGLGAGAFSLVSGRLAALPGMDAALDRTWDYHRIQTIGQWVAVAALAAVFVALLVERIRPRPVPSVLPLAVLALLPAYVGGALLYGSGGVTAGPFGDTAGSSRGPAVVEQSFVAVWPDLSAIDVAATGWGTAAAAAALSAADGPASSLRSVSAGGTYRRLHFSPDEASGGRGYRLRIDVPAGAQVATVPVPPGGYVSAATVDGADAGVALDFRLHYDTGWGAIGADARHALREGAVTVAAMAAVLAASLVALAWLVREREPDRGAAAVQEKAEEVAVRPPPA